MKALITAGGRGVRFRPITHTHNKDLIPIANKPMIDDAIESVLAAGIQEIGIVVGAETRDEVSKVVGDGKERGARISCIVQEKPSGLADAIRISQDFIGDQSQIELSESIGGS